MGLPLAKMTMAEFLAWEEQQTERHEFYRGDVFAMVGGTTRHNRVILNLASRIADHLDGSPCQVFAEGIKAQLADGYLYPDVMVTCGKALAGDDQAVSDPKLIIEVLSPSTKGFDKRDKFALYRALPSVQEFVLIDPIARVLEGYTRAEAGAWLFMDHSSAAGLKLASIDLEIPLEAIFKGVESAAA